MFGEEEPQRPPLITGEDGESRWNTQGRWTAWVPDERSGWKPLPFSRDIGTAWEVVERMQSQGWGYELSDLKNGEHCMLFIRWDPDAGANASGKTPAEAICRAALKALREVP